MRNFRGYTLIEMVMVLAVFGILLAIGYSRTGPALEHARVNRAATVVATDFQYAQLLAARERRPMVVIFDGSLKSYQIRQRDAAVTYRERFFGQDTDFKLDALAAAPPSVEFFPNGVARTTVLVTLGLGGYQRQVRLTQAGQVRILGAP